MEACVLITPKLQLEIASKYLDEGFLDSKSTVCYWDKRQVFEISNLLSSLLFIIVLPHSNSDKNTLRILNEL
jgi:hypothetical protein